MKACWLSQSTHGNKVREVSRSRAPSHGENTIRPTLAKMSSGIINGIRFKLAHLVRKLVGASLTRSSAASNENDAPVLLSERQSPVLVFEENGASGAELAHQSSMIGLYVNVSVGDVAVDVEEVEVDLGERARVLSQEEPCSEDARDCNDGDELKLQTDDNL